MHRKLGRHPHVDMVMKHIKTHPLYLPSHSLVKMSQETEYWEKFELCRKSVTSIRFRCVNDAPKGIFLFDDRKQLVIR